MAEINVRDLTIQFPIMGADSRSLKRHLAQLAVGGLIGQKRGSDGLYVQALENVSMDLAAGDRLGLVGPNGAGKTTLLRCLAGVYAPDRGSVSVRGRVSSLLEISVGIDPFATGYENIRMRGLLAGMSAGQIRAHTQEIADFSGLGPFLDMPMKSYSQGMLARLTFSVATAIQPDVLLMDEWLSVGDAGFRQQAQTRLESLVAKSSIVVLASHDPSLIKSMCNKYMILEGGVASEVRDIRDFSA